MVKLALLGVKLPPPPPQSQALVSTPSRGDCSLPSSGSAVEPLSPAGTDQNWELGEESWPI